MAPVKDHWYRTHGDGGPCVYAGCGRAQEDHVESCGEWVNPHHLFLPRLLHPFRCNRCDRRFGHSTHYGSRKNLLLYPGRWNNLLSALKGRP